MEYVLTGFVQDHNVRLFAFEGTGGAGNRTRCTVGVDVSLIRKYDISLQELPLICRHLLEQNKPVGMGGRMTLTEADMVGHANRRAAAKLALEQRRVQRKPPSPRVGEAWRQPSPFSRNRG